MIAVNELHDVKCKNKEIFESLLILMAPFAPHIAEELWEKLGNKNSILNNKYPKANIKFLKEEEIEYPISINGKTKTKIRVPSNISNEEVEDRVMRDSRVKEILHDRKPKKVMGRRKMQKLIEGGLK